jgi:ArsR family transcriptional regulator
VKKFIRVMKALSDPNRVKVMKILEIKQLCVCEITCILGLAQSTVSKHLKVLEDAELIDSCRDGAWVNYKLSPHSDNQYAALLQNNMKGWLAGDAQVKECQKLAKEADRSKICRDNEIRKVQNG